MKQFSEYSPSRRAVLLISSGLFSGYLPIASGTFASLLAIVLLYPFRQLNMASLPAGGIFAGLVVALAALAVWSADVAERTYGEKDSHKIVIDEIVGFLVAMAFLPFRWPQVAVVFFLYRFFDVVKPPPIRQSQVLPGGWGIVADDLLAGLYTCVILHGLMTLGILR